MADFNKDNDVKQGFDYSKDTQTSVGFITAIKVNGTDLAADIKAKDPEDSDSDYAVVGITSSVFWSTEVTGEINFAAQVSVKNKETIQTAVYNSLTNTSIEFKFAVYDYDSTANKYYKCFHDGDETLLGSISKGANGDLNISIDDDEGYIVQQPKNFAFNITIVPDPKAQVLHMQFSDTAKITKQWGIDADSD